MKRDSTCDPEQTYKFKEQDEFLDRVFNELAPKEIDILNRFYVEEQSCPKIMREMNLSETQYRLLKSRAKAKFGAIGKRLNEKKTLLATAASLAA
jgi:DNA-directed RNA polymerase specialized sigma subunit